MNELEEYLKNGWELISVCHDEIKIAKWLDENDKKKGYETKKFKVSYN